MMPICSRFQSTRPLRGATDEQGVVIGRVDVSIHAPLARRDVPKAAFKYPLVCFNPRAPCEARPTSHCVRYSNASFNPRAPCEARHVAASGSIDQMRFQSTRPLRGATHAVIHYNCI